MIDQLRDIGAGLNPTSADFQETALESLAAARERLVKGGETVKEYIVKEPARALAIALGVGVVIGWIIKRR